MDIFGSLGRFRKDQYDAVLDHKGDLMDPNNQPGSGSHGKPSDYGLQQGGPQQIARTPRVMPRMAGGNIVTAMVGELAPNIVEPLRAAIQPHFNGAMQEVFRAAPMPNVSRMPEFR